MSEERLIRIVVILIGHFTHKLVSVLIFRMGVMAFNEVVNHWYPRSSKRCVQRLAEARFLEESLPC